MEPEATSGTADTPTPPLMLAQVSLMTDRDCSSMLPAEFLSPLVATSTTAMRFWLLLLGVKRQSGAGLGTPETVTVRVVSIRQSKALTVEVTGKTLPVRPPSPELPLIAEPLNDLD